MKTSTPQIYTCLHTLARHVAVASLRFGTAALAHQAVDLALVRRQGGKLHVAVLLLGADIGAQAGQGGHLGAQFTRLGFDGGHHGRSEEHTSELQSLMRISYAVFCLTKNRHASIK